MPEEKQKVTKKRKIKKFFKSLFGREKETEELVEEGKPRQKLTPEKQEELNKELLKAAKSGDINTVKTCLNFGADINIQNKKGWTALIRAARHGNTDICKLLIEHGADINIQSKVGYTALMYAAWEGDNDTVRYLLSVGANPLLKTKEEETAYYLVGMEGMEEIEQMLDKYEELWKEKRLDKIYLGFKNKRFRTPREFKEFQMSMVNLANKIYSAVRNCEPSRIEGIIKNL